MALWWDRGQVIDDQERGIPEGATRVPTYQNRAQYGDAGFAWDPQNRFFRGTDIQTSAPGYLPELLARLDRQGQLKPYEAEELGQWEATARAMPTRDISTLQAGWQGDPGSQDWWSRLDPGSPDAGPVMLQLRDRVQAGTATPQEQALFGQVRRMGEDWDYRASAPQESDANPFGMGDQFMMALSALTSAVGGAGAFGAFAPALGAAGAGAVGSGGNVLGSLGPTLSTIGTAAGYGSQGAGMLGSALDQDWLSQIGRYLGAAGGLAGGLSGIGGALSGGIEGLSDLARLASGAGRVTGALGTATGFDPLRQAGRYLGYAGHLGRLGSGVQGLLGAAGQAQQAGMQPGAPVPRTMSDQDWLAQRSAGPWQQPQSTLWNL